MRPLAILVFSTTLAVLPARASVCAAASGTNAAGPRWKLDHYLYDASLHKDWEVLIDCDHPAAPARMQLVPNLRALPASATHTTARLASKSSLPVAPIGIKLGTTVEVSNRPGAPASIQLSGTAMQSALRGQHIRVRLSANGSFVNALVRGPHSVELAAAAKPSWGQP
ncbi:MAG: flagella basal body P-ring formation protein FlgA [Silvibacterium sp.]